jgi:hypothetical protein
MLVAGVRLDSKYLITVPAAAEIPPDAQRCRNLFMGVRSRDGAGELVKNSGNPIGGACCVCGQSGPISVREVAAEAGEDVVVNVAATDPA